MKNKKMMDLIYEEFDTLFQIYYPWFDKDTPEFEKKLRRPYRIKASKELIYYLKKINNEQANPLMNRLCKVLWLYDFSLPIYHRNYKKCSIDISREKDTRFTAYYDHELNTWIYNNQTITTKIDDVKYWYPTILEWLFIEDPRWNDWWSLLDYYAKKRYANKKNLKEDQP